MLTYTHCKYNVLYIKFTLVIRVIGQTNYFKLYNNDILYIAIIITT